MRKKIHCRPDCTLRLFSCIKNWHCCFLIMFSLTGNALAGSLELTLTLPITDYDLFQSKRMNSLRFRLHGAGSKAIKGKNLYQDEEKTILFVGWYDIDPKYCSKLEITYERDIFDSGYGETYTLLEQKFHFFKHRLSLTPSPDDYAPPEFLWKNDKLSKNKKEHYESALLMSGNTTLAEEVADFATTSSGIHFLEHYDLEYAVSLASLPVTNEENKPTPLDHKEPLTFEDTIKCFPDNATLIAPKPKEWYLAITGYLYSDQSHIDDPQEAEQPSMVDKIKTFNRLARSYNPTPHEVKTFGYQYGPRVPSQGTGFHAGAFHFYHLGKVVNKLKNIGSAREVVKRDPIERHDVFGQEKGDMRMLGEHISRYQKLKAIHNRDVIVRGYDSFASHVHGLSN